MLIAHLIDESIQALINANLSFGHGSDNPTDEAIHIVLWATGNESDELDKLIQQRTTVTDTDAANAREAIAKRINSREPAAYITGTAWLGGLSFHADARALVPRSLLVELLRDDLPENLQALGYPPTLNGFGQILDLCCGSGSIAIHAAATFKSAQVIGCDLSEDALALADENVQLHSLASRIRLIPSDLYASVGEHLFDLILCNPPYVNDESMQALPPEYLAEPDIALRGGATGMDLIKSIVSQAPEHLNAHGLLVLEIGHEAEFFEACFDKLAFSYLPVAAGDMMVVAVSREQIMQARS